MPLLNYTTQVSVHKTVGEIQQILAKSGAIAVSVDYDNQAQPVAITFLTIVHGDMINFRLPSRYDGVLKRLQKDPGVPRGLKTEEQARRVSWRIVKDWIEAQMAIIDAGQALLAEVFLPYAVSPISGNTLYQEFEQGRYLLKGGE